MKKQILLIDDDVDEFYILQESLSEAGFYFECTFAENVQEGIMSSRNSLPDFIFLDINMPGIDGFTGLSLIKKLGSLSHIPVILYSTAINTDIENKAIAMGAFSCIRKAASIKDLSALLKSFFLKILSLKEDQL
jgi:CheY-like chemotaxis protein